MDETMEIFAREKIKGGLAKCNEKMQHLFKRMYSHENTDLDINVVVDKMDSDNLSRAMTQVQRTLKEIETKTSRRWDDRAIDEGRIRS